MTAIDYDGLGRWGFKWQGHDHGTHVPMVDGYWTPWHEAATAITALRGEVAAAEKLREQWHSLSALDAHARIAAEAERDTLRAELADRDARLAEAVEAVKFLMEMSEPPERNCSCHSSPPCGWCTEYAGITEAHEYAASFLAKQEPSQ